MEVSGKLSLLLDDGSRYIYGLGLISRVVGSTTYYYPSDGLGSVLAVVDASGYVEQNYACDVFGAVTQQSGSTGNEPQFAGQQSDPDGLQYLRARYYDPATGRFLSRDAWSNDDKTVFHPYAYVSNNPSTGRDPTGHDGPECEDDDCGSSGNGGDMAPLPMSPDGADPPVLAPDLSIGYLLWQELARNVQLALGTQLTSDLESWTDLGVELKNWKGHTPQVDGHTVTSAEFGHDWIKWGGNRGFDQTGTMQDQLSFVCGKCSRIPV